MCDITLLIADKHQGGKVKVKNSKCLRGFSLAKAGDLNRLTLSETSC